MGDQVLRKGLGEGGGRETREEGELVQARGEGSRKRDEGQKKVERDEEG